MNIRKAIEIKLRKGDEFLNTDPDEIDEAERLSIEVLKIIDNLRYRFIGSPYYPNLLPGETEE